MVGSESLFPAISPSTSSTTAAHASPARSLPRLRASCPEHAASAFQDETRRNENYISNASTRAGSQTRSTATSLETLLQATFGRSPGRSVPVVVCQVMSDLRKGVGDVGGGFIEQKGKRHRSCWMRSGPGN